ncbi:hypothetical protein PROFUN_07994 [Planoprotostelium fungivorum]|uniref:AAA+ ATPase domain-containing protein n=1 Tax=Planoprotostelium fungivorum TaxID=1890364 RepID=A0A2P6MV86_9EUKA|nr:hypothetical protein PROFUN_07994 [Planoprotostelium fungivorum]
MEDEYKSLAEGIVKRWREKKSGQRYIIGIAGSPGSGKTTTAARIGQQLERLVPGSAVVLPMDGQLDEMSDPIEAHKRRGAPFTFWADGLITLLKKIKSDTDSQVLAPSFDHALKDPKEDDIVILPTHQIVIVEGNYILLNQEPWKRIQEELLDESIFISCDIDVAMSRLVQRHKQAWGVSPMKRHGRESNRTTI